MLYSTPPISIPPAFCPLPQLDLWEELMQPIMSDKAFHQADIQQYIPSVLSGGTKWIKVNERSLFSQERTMCLTFWTT